MYCLTPRGISGGALLSFVEVSDVVAILDENRTWVSGDILSSDVSASSLVILFFGTSLMFLVLALVGLFPRVIGS